MSTDTGEGPPISEEDAGVKDPKREDDRPKEKLSPHLQTEVGQATSALFNRRAKEEKANPSDNLSSKAIETADRVSKLDKDKIGDGFSFPDADGNDSEGNRIGNPVYVNVEGKRARLVSITECDDENFSVTYELDEGADDAGRGEPYPISREQMLQANLLSERDEILKGLSPDERAVAEAYFQIIDPEAEEPEANSELPKQVERVAEQNGLITAKWIKEASAASNGGKTPDKVVAWIQGFQDSGKTVLDRDDLVGVFGVLGVDNNWAGNTARALLPRLTHAGDQLGAAIKAGADPAAIELLQGDFDTIKGEMELYATVDKLLKAQEENGTDPLGNFLDAAASGEVDPKILAGIKSGNFDSLFDGIMQQAKDSLKMSDEDEADLRTSLDKLKSGSLTTLKFGGLLLALLAAIPAGAVFLAAGSAGRIGK